MSYLICDKHNIELECLGGCSAHPDNWFCPECDKEKSIIVSELYYLQDNRQYVGNDILWWAINGEGYTTDINRAQTYMKEQALSQHQCRETDIPWPKTYVDKHTRPAVDMQYVDIKTALQGTGIELTKPEKPKKEKFNCFKCGKFVTEDEYYQRIYAGYPCKKCEEENI